MEFSGIINLNQYAVSAVKQLYIKNQHSKIGISSQKTEENSFLSEFVKKNAEAQKARRIGDIKSKLKMGQKLSHGDMEYLRNNDPALYEKAVKIKKERETYRRDLNNCKTKKDAVIVNLAKLTQFKMEEKREDAEILMMRMAAILNEHVDFVRSKEYKDLPEDEIDKQEEEKEEASENLESAEAEKNCDNSKNAEKSVETEKPEKKNKKAKKINQPEVKTEVPSAYSVKQENITIFTSLRA